MRSVATLAFAVIVLAAVLLVVRPASAGTQVHPVSVRYHVVMPGETLFGIAGREVPGVDPRDTVLRIIELNALPGPDIRAGERIALPPGN